MFCGPRTKDRGYAWVILVMAFLTELSTVALVLGLAGNFTVAHQQVFNITLQESSTIGSVHTGLFFLVGKLSQGKELSVHTCRFGTKQLTPNPIWQYTSIICPPKYDAQVQFKTCNRFQANRYWLVEQYTKVVISDAKSLHIQRNM